MNTIITFGHGNPWDKEREWPVSAIEQMAVLEELDPQQTADLRADRPDFDFDREDHASALVIDYLRSNTHTIRNEEI